MADTVLIIHSVDFFCLPIVEIADSNFLLNILIRYVIIALKETTAHKGLTSIKENIENATLHSAKFWGGFSMPMYGYLQNVKTNVSSAKRKRPKVSISLKSN
jgi:hypothetical protein